MRVVRHFRVEPTQQYGPRAAMTFFQAGRWQLGITHGFEGDNYGRRGASAWVLHFTLIHNPPESA